MRERKAGTIINIGSIGDRKPTPGAPVYRLQARRAPLGESMNMSEAEHNVRVINVAPGLIRTAIHQKMGIALSSTARCSAIPPSSAQRNWLQSCCSAGSSHHICIRDIAVMYRCSF